jgi:hypothetical protein
MFQEILPVGNIEGKLELHGQALSPSAEYHGSRRKSRYWLLRPSAQPLRTLERCRPTIVEQRLFPAGNVVF